ncbi:MAG: hypothetical protein ABJD68_00670 [Nakamurella sp.]
MRKTDQRGHAGNWHACQPSRPDEVVGRDPVRLSHRPRRSRRAQSTTYLDCWRWPDCWCWAADWPIYPAAADLPALHVTDNGGFGEIMLMVGFQAQIIWNRAKPLGARQHDSDPVGADAGQQQVLENHS